MIFQMKTKPTNKQLIARALWLAFQASAPMGMGFLHASHASQQTEETLFEACEPDAASDAAIDIYTDYVFGRMMKTRFTVGADGALKISPETPRHDYQSWSGVYPTATALIKATEESFA